MLEGLKSFIPHPIKCHGHDIELVVLRVRAQDQRREGEAVSRIVVRAYPTYRKKAIFGLHWKRNW